MKLVRVREGSTGILRLCFEDGREEDYVPRYELEPARKLLERFRELKDSNGRELRHNYRIRGYNWYPTVVNHLYWQIFRNWVRYESLLSRHISGEIRCIPDAQGEFAEFLALLGGAPAGFRLKARLFNALILVNNALAMVRNRARLMLVRTDEDDFRTVRIVRALEEHDVPYTLVLPAARAPLLRTLARLRLRYFYGRAFVKDAFPHITYALDELEPAIQPLFGIAIRRTHEIIGAGVLEYQWHARLLPHSRFRVLYGIDNTAAIYPLLYGCREAGIRTIAHQHGAVYVKRHVSYAMEGVTKGDYVWFDQVVVWGQFWKDRLTMINEAYEPDRIAVGCDLFEFPRARFDSPGRSPKTVLIPYEFLANTAKVGVYMAKLIDKGFRVLFKPRADEPLGQQREAYRLPPGYWDRIDVVDRLTPDVLRQVDVVAGTTSTLLVQLACCGKPAWCLDTDFDYFEDLVDAGLMRRVRLSDLGHLSDADFAPAVVDTNTLSNDASLWEVMNSTVLSSMTQELPK